MNLGRKKYIYIIQCVPEKVFDSFSALMWSNINQFSISLILSVRECNQLSFWCQFYSDAIFIPVIVILEKEGTFNSPQIWRTKLLSKSFFKSNKNGVKSWI